LTGLKGSKDERAITVSHFLIDKLDRPVLREGRRPRRRLPHDESLFMGRFNVNIFVDYLSSHYCLEKEEGIQSKYEHHILIIHQANNIKS
jgi:hypothetical protein